MERMTIASSVRRHIKVNAAHQALDLYAAGESLADALEQLTPEMRRYVEGLLRATAESWGNAVTMLEETNNNQSNWLL